MEAIKILCEKNFQGAWVCSAIVEGVREHRIYMGFTKRFAMTDFRKYINSLNKAN
jgi:hypothetical protein